MQAQSKWPRPVHAWLMVLVLCLAQTASFIDRMILSLLVGPIRTGLGISDTGMSLLHGFGFAIFYSVMGLPIARLADTYNRKRIIVAGIALWSAMTATCG
ncbi:MAG: MFS transporter, partial [Alphaproteobacteria bacterium]